MRPGFIPHHRTLAAAAAILLAGLAVGACNEGASPTSVFGREARAREIAAGLQTLVHQSAEAEKRAVMAETDEAPIEFSREANAAADQVDAKAAGLNELLGELRYDKEQALLAEFAKVFAESRAVDRTILELAVENSNLKAHRLSHGDAAVAADDFEDRLGEALAAVPAEAHDRSEGLALRSQLAVERMRVLEAPHILEAEDDRMTALEKRMAAQETEARRTLGLLEAGATGAAGEALARAREALERFFRIHGAILTLSRRNTNVRSLALSLGQKRNLTAACDEAVAALQEELAGRGSRATR